MVWSIANYSTTPASNTVINGISLAEGCAPSGINDALRQLMSDLATYSSTITGGPYTSGSGFCTTANNLSDLANAATARTNLGVLAKTNNLSDVTNASTARTNLGLGTAAVAATGTSGATVPILNVANTWGAAQVLGSSTATTQTVNDNSTKLATTAYADRVALPAALGIGSYVLGGSGVNQNAGDTIAGASLTANATTISGSFASTGNVLSGTWRCMTAQSASQITLWQRIS